jgi:hypothetical protein
MPAISAVLKDTRTIAFVPGSWVPSRKSATGPARFRGKAHTSQRREGARNKAQLRRLWAGE